MQIISRKDSQGRTIGYDMVDEDGIVIKSSSAGGSPFNRTSAQLPGETSVALPTPLEGDFRTPEQVRGDEAAIRAEQERTAESQEDSEGGVNIPQGLLSELKGEQASVPTPKEAGTPERPGEGIYGPAFTNNHSYNIHKQIDYDLEEQRKQGGFTSLKAGVAQTLRNVGRGLVDGVEDVADFGAAVIDTIRGIEVNDEDNWYNPSAELTDPTSAAGNITKELVSFGTTTATGFAAASVLLPASAMAAASAIGGAGLKGNIIRGAVSGAMTDFVKAKPAEENLYNAVANTPLETPVSRFLAADTSEDASYWGTKVKEAIGGVPLGIGFDLLGSGVGKALSQARSEPMMKYLEGIREVKLLNPAEQESALRTVEAEVVEAGERTQKLLRAALDEDVKRRITDARRLLKAAEDPKAKGSIDIEIEESPIIAGSSSPFETFTPEDSQRIIDIEENLVALEDYRQVLNGMRNVDGPDQPLLNEVDNVIFALQDEIDAYDAKLNAPADVETPSARVDVPESVAVIKQAKSFELIDDAYEIPVAVFLRETGLTDDEARRLLINGLGNDEIDLRVRSLERDELASKFDLTDEEIERARLASKDASRSGGYDTIRIDKEYFDEAPESTSEFLETPTRTPQSPPQVPEGNRVESLLPNDGPGATPDRTPESYSGAGVGQREAVGDPSARKLQSPPQVPSEFRRERPVPFRNKAEIRQDVARKAVDKRVASARGNTSEGTSKASQGITGATEGASKVLKNKDGSLKGSQRVSKKSKRTAADVGVDLSKLNNKFPAKQSAANVDRFINMDKYGALDDDAIDVVRYVVDHIENNKLLDDLPDPVLRKEGFNFAQAVLHLDKDDAEALAAAYVSQTGNLPAARYGVRQVVASMSESVLDVAKQINPNKKFSELSIPERTLNEDLAFKVSQLVHFVELQKNIGKLSGQALRAGGVQLEDASTIMSKFNFFSKAKEATPKPDVLRDELSRMLRTPEGRKNFSKVVADLQTSKNFYEAMDALKVSKFAAMGNRASQLIHGVRMNGLLSGTRTNMTNVFANATMSLYTPMTQAVGAFVDMGWQRAMGNKVDGALTKEVAAEAVGMYRGMARNFKDSAVLAGRAARAGKGIIDTDQYLEEVRLDMLNPNSGNTMYDLTLKGLSMPSRGLLMGDEFFKQLSYRANVESRAYQEAFKKGLKGKRAKDFVNERLVNSFKIADDGKHATQGLGLDKTSAEYARYVTFQQEITKDNSTVRYGILQALEGINKIPGAKHITPLFVPFIKTPLNIVSHMTRNTPLGFVSKEFRNDLAAGGARRARAIGEMTMGSTALAGMYALGMEGRLTGRAPSDPKERELWYANGNQPYSLKISEKKSISFQRMEPFAGHLAIVADLFTTAARNDVALADEQENAAVAVSMAFITATKDRTFFDGISQLTELLTNIGSDDPRDKKSVAQAVENITTTLMPYSSLSNEFRKERDNTLRETEGILDAFMNKIPGLSKELPAQRNWLTGEPIQYGSSPLFNLYPTSQLKNDPLINKLIKYNTPIAPPDEKIGGVELSKEQYSDLLMITGKVEIDGKTLYQALSDEFGNHNLEELDAELAYLQTNDDYATKTPLYTELGKIRSRYIKAAEAALVQANPELVGAIRTRKLEEGNQKDGLFWMNSPLYEEVGYQYEETPGVQEALKGNLEDANKSLDKIVNDPDPLSIGE